jgi:hypothetical protein
MHSLKLSIITRIIKLRVKRTGKESEENDAVVAKDTSQQFIAVTQDHSPEMVSMAQSSEEVLAVSQVAPELLSTIQLPND